MVANYTVFVVANSISFAPPSRVRCNRIGRTRRRASKTKKAARARFYFTAFLPADDDGAVAEDGLQDNPPSVRDGNECDVLNMV